MSRGKNTAGVALKAIGMIWCGLAIAGYIGWSLWAWFTKGWDHMPIMQGPYDLRQFAINVAILGPGLLCIMAGEWLTGRKIDGTPR